jgi:hypothetical protein
MIPVRVAQEKNTRSAVDSTKRHHCGAHRMVTALTKALHNRRSPWYQRSLIREPLRKISVILSDDIQRSFRGQLTMVLGK